jgi:predicted outer membrane protein
VLAGLLCALTTVPAILAIQRLDHGGTAGGGTSGGGTSAAESGPPTGAVPAGAGARAAAAVPAHAPSGGAHGVTEGASPVTPVVNSNQVGDGRLPSGWTMTRFGPLSPADRDILVRVRLAGLWEAPAGVLARERSTNPKVKEVGTHLATEHTRLDEQVRSVASQLDVALPNEPNADQRSWLDELSSRRGDPFDQVFTARLRAAHGKVLAVLSTIRAGTRNDLIRSFTQVGIDIVMRHMTLLEGTGLVAYADLPAPPDPPTQVSTFASRSGPELLVVWVIVAAAVVVGVRAAWSTFRAR